MRIQVSGKQIDVGEALRSHAEEKLGEIVGKYAERPVEANVTSRGTPTSSRPTSRCTCRPG
jgi:ribosome-associated translation inhibitor RaiA